jgi:aryl-alcohol dehydrogenase
MEGLMKIKAAVVEEPGGEFRVQELDLAEPRDDEVLVRLVATGICHTDLAGRDMHLPIPAPPSVFGHEGAGVVERVGSRVAKVRPGDHVVLGWDYCGVCAACKSGKELYCLNFFLHNFHGARPDGSSTLSRNGDNVHGSFFCQSSFAEYGLANERNVVKVQDAIPLEILGPMGCGVMTGAGAVMNAFRAAPGSSIAIFGIGPVGMSAVLAANVCGCTTVIAVDVNPERLKIATRLGATHAINAQETEPVAAVRELTGGGPAYSLECVGNPKVFRQAVDVLPRLGVCGLTGVVPPGTEVALDMDLIMNGRTVRGILGGDAIPDLFIPRLLDLYQQGRFPFDQLITFYPFDQINQAARDMEQGRVIKPVLRF